MTTALAAVVCGVLAAVIAHEAGHGGAAYLLGARTVRVRMLWPRVRVDADVAPDGWRAFAFLAAGPLANVVVAAVAFGVGGRDGVVVGVVNGAFAVANLVPHGDSDGARMLALCAKRRR